MSSNMIPCCRKQPTAWKCMPQPMPQQFERSQHKCQAVNANRASTMSSITLQRMPSAGTERHATFTVSKMNSYTDTCTVSIPVQEVGCQYIQATILLAGTTCTSLAPVQTVYSNNGRHVPRVIVWVSCAICTAQYVADCYSGRIWS